MSNGSHSREHLDKAYRGWDKDTYPKQGNQKALCRVLDYVEAGTNPQCGLGLVGPVGCGKTSLAVTAYKLVAPRLLEYPAVPASRIQFVSVLDMFDVFRSSFDEDRRTGEPRYAQLYKRFAEARLLVLDDLGAERPTEWTQEQLNKLIDSRARNELRALVYDELRARRTRAVDHAALLFAPGVPGRRVGSDRRGLAAAMPEGEHVRDQMFVSYVQMCYAGLRNLSAHLAQCPLLPARFRGARAGQQTGQEPRR